MKVRVLDRIIIFFISLLLLVLAAVLALYAWGFLNCDMIGNLIKSLQGYWVNTVIFSAVAVLLALIAIRLFVSACRRDVSSRKQVTALIDNNENGAITIAIPTVQNFAKQYIMNFKPVKTAHVWVRTAENGNLDIKVKIAVGEEAAIPEMTRNIQVGLMEQLQMVTGLKTEHVAVLVDNTIAPRTNTASAAR